MSVCTTELLHRDYPRTRFYSLELCLKKKKISAEPWCSRVHENLGDGGKILQNVGLPLGNLSHSSFAFWTFLFKVMLV